MTIFRSEEPLFRMKKATSPVAFFVGYHPHYFQPGGDAMKIRKKFLDYEYEEVLDPRTRELIRVGCAVAVGCPD
jgi:alkylhydroperoxidase/carboxymuconolactone decarboxylase family protein YurZ